MRARPLSLAAIALFITTLSPTRASAQQTADKLLASMKAAAAKHASVHAVVHAIETADGKTTRDRHVECWIDVKGGRVRTEVRDHGRALPHLLFVANGEGLRIHQLEIDEFAEQKVALGLPDAVASSLAGELLSTAFRGDLVSMKLAAYGKPVIVASGTVLGDVPIVELLFAGNAEARLWIGEKDDFPRKLRGPLGRATLEETIERLDLDASLANVDFTLPVVEGTKLLDPVAAHTSWKEIPPEHERWFKPQDGAPDFAALALDGQPHLLSEFGQEEVVLAFWFAEDGKSAELAKQVESAALARADAKLPLIHVAAGAEREPVAAAAARLGLKRPIWVAGSHEKSAFRQFRIYTCPVFVKLSDLTVVAITRDVDVATSWFK